MTSPYDDDDFRPFRFSVCKGLGPIHGSREHLAMTDRILDLFIVSEFLDFLTMSCNDGEDSWPFYSK
jgi:hypothetical protein